MARKKGGVLSLKDVDRVFAEKKKKELQELAARASTQRVRPVIAERMGSPVDLSPRSASPVPFGQGKRRKTRRRRHSNWR